MDEAANSRGFCDLSVSFLKRHQDDTISLDGQVFLGAADGRATEIIEVTCFDQDPPADCPAELNQCLNNVEQIRRGLPHGIRKVSNVPCCGLRSF